MKKMNKGVVAALVVAMVVAGVSGCRKEGPAERAGKQIDRSIEKAGKKLGKAGEKMKGVIKILKSDVPREVKEYRFVGAYRVAGAGPGA